MYELGIPGIIVDNNGNIASGQAPASISTEQRGWSDAEAQTNSEDRSTNISGNNATEDQLKNFQEREKRQRVIKVVAEWKKLQQEEKADPENPFKRGPQEEQRQRRRDLQRIKENFSKQDAFDVASYAYQAIKEHNLEFGFDPFSKKDTPEHRAYQQAVRLKSDLEDIVAFAKWLGLPNDEAKIEKAGDEWFIRDQERQKSESLTQAQHAFRELQTLLPQPGKTLLYREMQLRVRE